MRKELSVLFPEISLEEFEMLEDLTSDLSESQLHDFAHYYRIRRKEPQTILLLAIVGFFGVAGIHRFLMGQILMGVVYVLTGGLCLIGTIVDIINYKNLTLDHNYDAAKESLDRMYFSGSL